MSSSSLSVEQSLDAPPDQHLKQLIREALGELANSPLDGAYYNRIVEAFVRRNVS